jgi:hypothetical protein
MADFVGVPVVMVGVGPGRDDVIWLGASETTVAGRLAAAAS